MPIGGGGAGRKVGRRASALPGLLSAAAVLAATLVVAVLGAGPTRAQAADLEAASVSLVAGERRAVGLAPLSVEPDLVAVARRHSATMAAQNRLFHNPALAQEVAGWVSVGENVGKGARVDAVHAALMASATHRAEILKAVFTDVGVGVVQADGVLWVTQVFRQRASGPVVAASPAPVPVPTDVPVPSAPVAAPAPSPGPPAPPARAVAERASAPAPSPVAPRTTTTSASTTTAAPATTTTAATTTTVAAAPPPLVTLDVAAAPPDAALAVPVASSVPLPVRPDLVGIGTLAAGLLWVVVAGLAGVELRPRFATRR